MTEKTPEPAGADASPPWIAKCVSVPIDEVRRIYNLPKKWPEDFGSYVPITFETLCTCGHTYRFHQEHWPACKGFTPETK